MQGQMVVHAEQGEALRDEQTSSTAPVIAVRR